MRLSTEIFFALFVIVVATPWCVSSASVYKKWATEHYKIGDSGPQAGRGGRAKP